jgi:hypothetical protein
MKRQINTIMNEPREAAIGNRMNAFVGLVLFLVCAAKEEDWVVVIAGVVVA